MENCTKDVLLYQVYKNKLLKEKYYNRFSKYMFINSWLIYNNLSEIKNIRKNLNIITMSKNIGF